MKKRLFAIVSSIVVMALLGVLCYGCGKLNNVHVIDNLGDGDKEALSSFATEETTDAIEEEEEDEFKDFEYPYGAGVFSWDHLADDIDTRCLIDNKITEVYQYIKPEYTEEEIIQFLKRMSTNDISVYFLDGEAEWSYKENYSGMKNVLEKVAYYNKIVDKKDRIKGIVYDVEPYVLDKWHNIPDQLLDEYCDNVERIMEEKEKTDDELNIYVCVPYSYDLMGRDNVLKNLIGDADGILVLNYYKGHEIDNINREVSLSWGYSKRIINVYELQPGLLSQTTDTITYYKDGLSAVKCNYSMLLEAYPSRQIGIAYHTLEYLRVLSLN